ncbi:hypothetical protein RhoFasB10_05017 [Rhodococcus sp. B10]|nr:hypothetical protein [Rhodococcus sp. B10]
MYVRVAPVAGGNTTGLVTPSTTGVKLSSYPSAGLFVQLSCAPASSTLSHLNPLGTGMTVWMAPLVTVEVSVRGAANATGGLEDDKPTAPIVASTANTDIGILL